MLDNYFAFNYADDFVIMPEEPIAMVFFHSRLYVWGQRKLYKVDPHNLVIEDEYDGISILNKNAFVKTEYGLCFMDANNIYIHDGNTPHPIGDDILYATDTNVVYESHANGPFAATQKFTNGDSDTTLPTLNGQSFTLEDIDSAVLSTDFASSNEYDGVIAGSKSIKCTTGTSVEYPKLHYLNNVDCGLTNGIQYHISAYVRMILHSPTQTIDTISLIVQHDTEFETLDSVSISAGTHDWHKLEADIVYDDSTKCFGIQGWDQYGVSGTATVISGNIFYVDQFSIVGYEQENSADGYIILKQGYIELAKQCIANGHIPSLHYSGLKNSFVVFLSDDTTEGKAFVYNLKKKRWDFWDAPKPVASISSKNSDILITDGSKLWNYVADISSQPDEYNRRQWDWFSKNINFGIDNQEKVFKTLSFTGMPCYYNYKNVEGALVIEDKVVAPIIEGVEASITKTDSIQAFVDDVQVSLTIMDKFYDITSIGNTVTGSYTDAAGGTKSVILEVPTLTPAADGGVSGTADKYQTFIRAGMYIKINDEIMFVTNFMYPYTNYDGTNLGAKATVIRGALNTTIAESSPDTPVYIVSPKMKFPSATKGNRLKIKLFKQEGHIDSVAVSYKPKAIK